MSKFYDFLKKKYVLIILIAVALVSSYLIYSSRSNDDLVTIPVSATRFEQQVSVAGKVIPAENVDLGFESTGKVSAVYKDVGDIVKEGEYLVSLDNSSLSADLNKYNSELSAKKLSIKNDQIDLENVKSEQGALVENAYRKMLSDGLEAVISGNSESTITPPDVFGAYTGKEGIYKLIIDRSGINNGYELSVFGLEKIGKIEIRENEPTPVGKNGLFINFSDDLSYYQGTVWYISIPNVKSSEYLDNYNNYTKAIATRDREVALAESKLKSINNANIVDYESSQIQSQIDKIRSEIASRIIVAPFSGLITKQDAKVGSIVTANTPVMTLISDKEYQIETFVPEINIKDVGLNNLAKVTLDAYGDSVIFDARVISIDPAETLRDGVSSYKVKFEFVTDDDRIRSGMTSNVDITTKIKEDTILIPQTAITKKNGFSFVTVKVGSSYVEKQVTTGGISISGDIEIVSGLNIGELVVVSPDKLSNK